MGRDSEGIKVYIINLLRSPHRRETMARRMAELGIDFEFFPAVDGGELDISTIEQYNRPERLRKFGADLTARELGCYLSHYRVLEHCCHAGVDHGVILEDDAVLAPDLPELLRQIAALPPDIELIRLAGARLPDRLPACSLSPGHQLTRLLGVTCTTTGYAVSSQGAIGLVKALREITMQIDCALDRYWDHGIRSYAIVPYPVLPDPNVVSDIGARVDVWKQPGMGHFRLRRRFNKMTDGLARRFVNIGIRCGNLVTRDAKAIK